MLRISLRARYCQYLCLLYRREKDHQLNVEIMRGYVLDKALKVELTGWEDVEDS